MPEWFLLLAVALVGLAVASFSGVIISRLPLELEEENEFGETWDTRPWKDVLGGRSECATCGAPVRPVQNIPIVSWLVLRGRCASCGARIPATLLFVEIALPALAVWTVWARGWTWTTAPILLLLVVGMIISVIDLQVLMVPTRVVWPAFFVAVTLCAGIALGMGEAGWLVSAVIGVAALAGPLFALWWMIPRGMGFGDVRFAVLIGWVVGFQVGAAGGGYALAAYCGLMVLTLAAVVGIVMGVVSALAQVRSMKTVPFGPALALAGFLICLAAPNVVDAFG